MKSFCVTRWWNSCHSRGVNFALGSPSNKLPTFGTGGNPDHFKAPQRGTTVDLAVPRNSPQAAPFVRYAEIIHYWIPACAGMTGIWV
jgi:hypothetical protein